jgi:hypothetical protein
MLKRLEIKPTVHSLHVILDAENNIFTFEGKSFPEDSKVFFQPIINWLESYKSHKPTKIILHCNIYYLSSSSTISFKQILTKLKELEGLGANVSILWQYDDDDDDILKTGEDYMKLVKLPFQFITNP